MHGLPCSSLQYCFGSPADVSADPAAHTASETCHAEFAPAELPQPISAQPVPKEPVAEARDSSSVSCHVSHVSIPSKAPNGTKPNSDEPQLEDVHTLQSSPSLRELSDSEAPEGSPDLGIKYPQIPRPSIIKHPQVTIELLILYRSLREDFQISLFILNLSNICFKYHVV